MDLVQPALLPEPDLSSPLLSPRDAELIRALIEKRRAYDEQGRGRESHGVAAALAIVWQMVTEPDIPIELPDTTHLDL